MNPWHVFTHWLTSDMYTLEERAVMREEARRLKLRTDLQEQRIAARKERAERWITVGTWIVHCRMARGIEVPVDVNALFYLEQQKNGAARRVRGGPVTKIDNGQVVENAAKITAFIKSRPEYYQDIEPWLQWTYATSRLSDVKGIDLI